MLTFSSKFKTDLKSLPLPYAVIVIVIVGLMSQGEEPYLDTLYIVIPHYHKKSLPLLLTSHLAFLTSIQCVLRYRFIYNHIFNLTNNLLSLSSYFLFRQYCDDLGIILRRYYGLKENNSDCNAVAIAIENFLCYTDRSLVSVTKVPFHIKNYS